VLATQERPPADVASDVELIGTDVPGTSHDWEGEGSNALPSPPAGLYASASASSFALSATFWARWLGISS
jgi:hypothetical protein